MRLGVGTTLLWSTFTKGFSWYKLICKKVIPSYAISSLHCWNDLKASIGKQRRVFKSAEVKENIFSSILALDAVLKITREHVHGGTQREPNSAQKFLCHSSVISTSQPTCRSRLKFRCCWTAGCPFHLSGKCCPWSMAPDLKTELFILISGAENCGSKGFICRQAGGPFCVSSGIRKLAET